MSSLTRRDVMLGTASLLVPPGLASRPAAGAADVPSLKALGAARGIEVGSCYSGQGDALDRALLERHAAIITPEWCMKPRFLKPDEDGPYRFEEADALHAYCRDAGIAMHGHTLFWHGDRFDWADDPSFEVATRKYGRFMASVMVRYPDLPSWDVASEVVDEPGPGLRRDDYLIATHGLEFVAFLFRRARNLAPRAKLCFNDYNLECAQSWCTDKRKHAVEIVDAVHDEGVRIDAVGIQSHLSSRYGAAIDETLDLCEQLASRGVSVYISELDVNDIVLADDIATRDAEVAEIYHTYLTALLGHPAVTRVVFWGLSDRNHWMVREEIDDGRPVGQGRPAPFDHDGRPKPAFHAVAAALKAAPQRR